MVFSGFLHHLDGSHYSRKFIFHTLTLRLLCLQLLESHIRAFLSLTEGNGIKSLAELCQSHQAKTTGNRFVVKIRVFIPLATAKRMHLEGTMGCVRKGEWGRASHKVWACVEWF